MDAPVAGHGVVIGPVKFSSRTDKTDYLGFAMPLASLRLDGAISWEREIVTPRQTRPGMSVAIVRFFKPLWRLLDAGCLHMAVTDDLLKMPATDWRNGGLKSMEFIACEMRRPRAWAATDCRDKRDSFGCGIWRKGADLNLGTLIRWASA